MCGERPARAGFTLPELIIAIVVISVGLAGVLLAFRVAVKGSADPLIHKQMLAIAEEMMAEIGLKPFSPPGHTGGSAGCAARDGFVSLDDYNGYACAGIRPIDDHESPIPALGAYGIAVAVTKPAAAWNDIPADDVRRIEVRVTNGGETLRLAGWRTNWAKP